MVKGDYSYSKETESLILSLYSNGVQVKDIFNKTGVSVTTIYRLLKRKNVKTDRWEHVLHVNDETQNKFIQKYQRNDYYPFIPSKDYSLCKNNCVTDYFDVIDDSDKAYILGLLYADGNINKSGYVCSITLQERDKSILNKISDLIYKEDRVKLVKSKNVNWQNSYCLRICSKRVCDALMYYGLHPTKSLDLRFPTNIPFQFYKDFFRGYVDGDGSIFTKGKNAHVYFISTKSFCEEAQFFIENCLDINCSVYPKQGKYGIYNGTTYYLQIGGRNQVSKFLEWIYKDSSLYIERKYNDYLAMCDFADK